MFRWPTPPCLLLSRRERKGPAPKAWEGEGLRRLGLAATLALLAAPALATDVTSPRPDAVGVTIYRDERINDPAAQAWEGEGLAMISETRTVDLPAGQSRLVFSAVADGLIPQTATLEGLPGKVAEQNFDFDLLGPGSLIAHSVGRPVHVIRTDRKTGRETREDAIVRSGPAGVVLDFGAGRVEGLQCSGGAERLVFDDVPPGLTGAATLSTTVRVATPGRYRLTLTYLTVGLAWRAGYVARLSPEAETLDLTGWITLANHGDTGFNHAPTAVVAGRLAREAVARFAPYAERRAAACWPSGNSHHPRGDRAYGEREQRILGIDGFGRMREETIQDVPMAVTAYAAAPPANPRATESNLGDYKLYTLDEATTVAAHQTKQVMFLTLPGVKFDRLYAFRIDAGPSGLEQASRASAPAITTLRLENKAANGLGRALPAGAVSVRQGGLLVGEPNLRDVSVNEPFELELGQASDVRMAWRVTAVQAVRGRGHSGYRADVEVTLTNAKSAPVAAEVRHPAAGAKTFRITAESRPHTLKSGDPLWRVPLAAGESVTFTYTVLQMFG